MTQGARNGILLALTGAAWWYLCPASRAHALVQRVERAAPLLADTLPLPDQVLRIAMLGFTYVQESYRRSA